MTGEVSIFNHFGKLTKKDWIIFPVLPHFLPGEVYQSLKRFRLCIPGRNCM